MISQAEELLYGGAVGGGKSYALRAFGVNYCLTYPGAKGALFRRSFRQLEETHLIEIPKEVPNSIAHLNAKHDLNFIDNGSIFMFRFCETDEDARGYDTSEFDFILFDEITHFTQAQYTYLTSRCRSSKRCIKHADLDNGTVCGTADCWWEGPRIRCGGTPLGQGHSWVKARWHPERRHDPAPFEIWKGPVEEGEMTRQFIPAKVYDNPKIDKSYMKRLRALPEEEYRAKALGDWSVSTDQFFTKWDYGAHTIAPFDIPPDWDRYICHDYGSNAPMATLWIARPPETKVAYVYREQYGKDYSSNEQIQMAYEASSEMGEKIRAVILDPSIFNKINYKGEKFDSIADDWKDSFNLVLKGDNARVNGWRLVRQMLDWTKAPDGDVLVAPRLKIFTTCHNLIRTLPDLKVNENLVEDVDSDGEDHAADALRYGLMHIFLGGGAPHRRTPTVSYKNGRLVTSRV